MNTNPKIAKVTALATSLALALMTGSARACDICMGGKDPTIRPAVNGAIFFMLGIVAIMAASFGFFILYLAKRARAPLPPYQELLQ